MSNILKYQNPSSPLLKPWKALEKMNYEAIPDSTFTRDKTGIGSIEYFSADNNNGITYLNGYHKAHPKPGTDVILYDPTTNDQQDVRLDALHLMPKDPIYGALYDIYRYNAKEGDVMHNAKRRYAEDASKYGVENIDSFDQYFTNEADGLLRNMFIEGTPEYIKSKRYYPNKAQLEQWNAHLMPYINDIKTYLETGVKPEHIIEPAVVTAESKKATDGGLNKFTMGGELNTDRETKNINTDSSGDTVDDTQYWDWELEGSVVNANRDNKISRRLDAKRQKVLEPLNSYTEEDDWDWYGVEKGDWEGLSRAMMSGEKPSFSEVLHKKAEKYHVPRLETSNVTVNTDNIENKDFPVYKIYDTVNYISDLYNTKRAVRSLVRDNRRRLRAGLDKADIFDLNTINLKDYHPVKSTIDMSGNVDLGIAQADYEPNLYNIVLAHEIAHRRNTYNPFRGVHGDQPGDYSHLPKRYQKWLKPVNPANEHNAEIAEAYGDLMGLRVDLKDKGIADGIKRRYKNRDIKNYLNLDTYETNTNRYLQYHPNINHVRKALNRVWKDGGKLNRFDNGGILKYQNPPGPILSENSTGYYQPINWSFDANNPTLNGSSPVFWTPDNIDSKNSPQESQQVETQVSTLPEDEGGRVQYWMKKFASFGLTTNQQLALVAAMKPECSLKPQGSVNKHELTKGGGTKGGWAHAGEGTVHFTHWDIKKKFIDLYNSDPRRQGPELSNIEAEYADPNARHIADLSDDDHALFTYLCYKPILDRTKNINFNDLVAEFYLQKAGRNFATGATPYAKAVATGQHYQRAHAKQGHLNAAKVNNFIRSLNYAKNLAKQYGIAIQ